MKNCIDEAEIECSDSFDAIKAIPKAKRGRKQGVSMSEKYDQLSPNIQHETVTIPCDTHSCPECDENLVPDSNTTDYKLTVIPGSFLTPSLAAELLTNKYVLDIPLYRMEKHYESFGLPLSRQSMANYMITVACELEPLYELMKKFLINNHANVIHCDETTLKVIKTTCEDRSTCYMWVYLTSFFDVPIYIYEFQESMGGVNPKVFLKDYKGYIVSDGYKVYRNIDNVTMISLKHLTISKRKTLLLLRSWIL